MPVDKFKNFEDAEKALWNFNPDGAYFKRVAELWAFADQLNPIVYPKGIFKFKNLEEANRQRYELALAHAKKVQAGGISTTRK
jgi:hypothetical protein